MRIISLLTLLSIYLISCNTQDKVQSQLKHKAHIKIYAPGKDKIDFFSAGNTDIGKTYYKDNKVGNRVIKGNDVKVEDIRTLIDLYGSFLAANDNDRLESLFTKGSKVPLVNTETIAKRNMGGEESITVLSSFVIKYNDVVYGMNKVLYQDLDGEKSKERFVYIRDENREDRLIFTTEIKDEKLQRILDVFYRMKSDVAIAIFNNTGYMSLMDELPSSENERLNEIIEKEVESFTIGTHRNMDKFLLSVETWEKDGKTGLLNYFFEQ